MKNNTPTILVLGGKGFIGRHVVHALVRANANILIGTRYASTTKERTVKLQDMTHAKHWGKLAAEADVIINTVGILRQRHAETYEQIHHKAVAHLAAACEKYKTRLIHVSALGLANQVKSRFLISKRKSEHALQQSQCDWAIVRPSLVDGQGGFGAKWLRRTARWPVHFKPANAKGNIAPIDAHDLGQAIANIALCENLNKGRIFELGGNQIMTFNEYQCYLGKQPPHYRVVNIPALIARGIAHICDALHVTPFSFGHYELLKFDNVPIHNRLRETLHGTPKQFNLDRNHPRDTIQTGNKPLTQIKTYC